ncbi:MAG: AAA family ATPase [Trueperaceae bacterium]|nr:AAA family ATPase [Trueperaceae bacterium]
MAPHEVQLFGRPELHVETRRRYLGANHVDRFVAYLAFRAAWVPRDEVIFLFWPDRIDAVGRRNLRKLLHRAHREIAGIETQGNGLRWLVGTDVLAWREALRLGNAEGALASMHGPLLEGLDTGAPAEFTSWLARERDEVRVRLVAAVVERCRELERLDPEAAAALSLELLKRDPLDERAVRCCLRSLAHAGRAEALGDVYRAYVRDLDADIGVEPDEATRALYLRLAAASHDPDAHERADLPVTRQSSETALLRSAPVPWGTTSFVGRDAEMMRLREALASALAGTGGVIDVEGEAGVGKTRLIEAFLGSVPAGVRVFSGRCYERDLSMPLEPVRSALGAWDAPGGPRPEEGLRLVATEARDHGTTHQALTARMIIAARPKHGAVLFIDDLQWADAETLAFLSYLAHRIRDERVLVVVSHRREDRHLLEAWRSGLSERRAMRTVRLDRFETGQTRSLVAEIFGGEADELTRFADFVHSESEGNPFYALEYLRWLHDADALELAPDRRVAAASWERIAEVEIPDSIRSLIWTRYRGFADEARTVLDAAAVIGRSFGFDLLRHVTGQSDASLWSALEPLIAAGSIVAMPGGSYAFSHDKLRQTIYESLGLPTRRNLHARAGAALEAVHADDADLAHHFLRAEMWPRAYQHLRGAAEAAEADGAWEVARKAYARMLMIAPHLEDPDRKRFDALLGTERLLEFMERRPEWIDTIERLTALAARIGAPRMMAEAALKRMAMRSVLGDPEGASDAFAHANALFADLGDAGASARAYRDVAYLAWMRGDYHEVLKASTAAIGIDRQLGHRRAVAATAENISHAYRWLGDAEQATRWAQEAAETYRQLGDVLGEYVRLDDLAWAHMQRGENAAATSVLERLLPICLRLNDRHLVVEKHMTLGKLYLGSRRYRNALGSFEAANRLGAGTGDLRHEGYPLISAGVAQEALGAYEDAARNYLEAARLLETSYALTGTAADETGQGDALTLHGGVARRRLGRWKDARRSLMAAEAIFRRSADMHRLGLVQMELGTLHWAAGDLDQAVAAYLGACDTAARAGSTERAISARASLGVVYRDLGRLEESIEAGRDAVLDAQGRDDRLGEAFLLTSLASSYRRAGRIDEARDCLERSLALRRDCGDTDGEAAMGEALAALTPSSSAEARPA